tara:strand:- start:110 stop:268 length:159 start_codon:yes stop_codon:yes gene_type:complete
MTMVAIILEKVLIQPFPGKSQVYGIGLQNTDSQTAELNWKELPFESTSCHFR